MPTTPPGAANALISSLSMRSGDTTASFSSECCASSNNCVAT